MSPRVNGIRQTSTSPSVAGPLYVLPWADQALCAQSDPELWFDLADRWKPTPTGEREPIAKSICRRCPVQVECLRHALDDPSLEGIWGGLTTRDRKALRRLRRAS